MGEAEAKIILKWVVFLGMALLFVTSLQAQEANSKQKAINVPIDHNNPELGTFSLYFE
ncbi:unnamed protein product, partial [marine sediment metagenome]